MDLEPRLFLAELAHLLGPVQLDLVEVWDYLEARLHRLRIILQLQLALLIFLLEAQLSLPILGETPGQFEALEPREVLAHVALNLLPNLHVVLQADVNPYYFLVQHGLALEAALTSPTVEMRLLPVELGELQLDLVDLAVIDLQLQVVLLLLPGELGDGLFLGASRDGLVLDHFCFRVDLLPVVEDADDHLHYCCVFADALAGRLFERYLVYDTDYAPDLLDLYPSQLPSLEEVHVVLQAFLDNAQAFLDVRGLGGRVKLLHEPAGVLHHDEEAVEQHVPGLVTIAEVQIDQQVLDELIDKKDLQVSLLFLFIEHLKHFGVGVLVKELHVVVVEVFDALGVEVLVFDELVEHFDEDGVIGAQHRPKVQISVGLVNEDGVGRRVHVQKRQRPEQVPFPLAVAVLDAAQQFCEVVAMDAIVLEHAVNQHHQAHPALLEVVQRAIQMHETILDFLGHCEHGVDVQGQRAQSFVHLLDGEDAMLRGQFLQGRVRNGLDH